MYHTGLVERNADAYHGVSPINPEDNIMHSMNSALSTDYFQQARITAREITA